jgi:hypothetical protein
VKHTPKTGLCRIDFEFDGKSFRGLEQNPGTKSRWAKLARIRQKDNAVLSRRWELRAAGAGLERTAYSLVN